ncbi:MobA/MobL family protein [Brevundimonas sp.]|jgi:hypothetical protein|uniref:MobA/MobL family protein n=1 Tax=Brevundimonas sp. TaxID=1871086 RepID=UPI002E0FD85B|nr:MobA/MobL family protein [Brevundimonas sp.]
MAIYSCNLSSVGRTTHAAGTAGCHLRYIAREGANPIVEAHGVPLEPGAAQVWMDREEAAARANARLIDKVRIAIPRELTRDERVQLVRAFVRDLTTDRVPWMFAIHQDGEDEHNPHAHIVLRDRDLVTGKRVLHLSDSARDREKMGLVPKAVEWIRERWEHHANVALEKAGHEVRIDRRTLAAQGIDREPTIHLGPRAEHIDRFVERPRSKTRTTPLGREIDYPTIDQGRTRRERNAEIIDLNLERQARSPDLETRVWAQFERGQNQLDRRLESQLADQARGRTREERALMAGFRTKLRSLSDERRADYLARVGEHRLALAPRVLEMRQRQGRERIALHLDQSSFWSKLCRAVDVTGGTRRRHQATRRALVTEHREERDVLARVSRASWIALKQAVRQRYAPAEEQLLLQRKGALSALREMHSRAEAMAEGKRQIREAHRERDRTRTADVIRKLKQSDPRSIARAADEPTWPKREAVARAFETARQRREGRSSEATKRDPKKPSFDRER